MPAGLEAGKPEGKDAMRLESLKIRMMRVESVWKRFYEKIRSN